MHARPSTGSSPTGCPNVGDLCSDGSYYIGQLGGDDLYATAPDSESSQTWNNGTSNWTATGFTSTADGPGNTAGLVALSDAGAPYDAAEYCDGLASVHGHSDWYLPAKDELNLLYNGGASVAGVETNSTDNGDWYWSSTDGPSNYGSCHQRMSSGFQDCEGWDKSTAFLVKCLRRVAGGGSGCINPAGVEGQILYNSDHRVLQGCAGGEWRAFGPPGGTGGSGPTGCDTIGDLCDDGSYYAGELGDNKVYAAPADESGTYTWGGWSNNLPAAASTTDGLANTNWLVDNSPFTHPAAQACRDKGEGWYLPAKDELHLLYNGGSPIAGVLQGNDKEYWSSTEVNGYSANIETFNDGWQGYYGKDYSYLVRCVRRVGGGSGCTDPVRPAGAMIYNETHSVMQYCDGANWVSIGKGAPAGPTGCPAIGDVCSDGSIYAGLSPDGNVKMYTTAADEGTFYWNDGSAGCCFSTGATSDTSGASNTATLVGLSNAYEAAKHCDELSIAGHSDWYLPARDELSVVYDNKESIGGYDTSGTAWGGYYWTSEENPSNNTQACMIRFNDAFYLCSDKTSHVASVRCVRKD